MNDQTLLKIWRAMDLLEEIEKKTRRRQVRQLARNAEGILALTIPEIMSASRASPVAPPG